MKAEICIKNTHATFSSVSLTIPPGFIKSFLSLGFWVPLSNISFACYLTHPVFILLYIGLQETPIHFTGINFVSTSDRIFIMLKYFKFDIVFIVFSMPFKLNVLYVSSPL